MAGGPTGNGPTGNGFTGDGATGNGPTGNGPTGSSAAGATVRRLDRPPAIVPSYLRALARRSARHPESALPATALLLAGVAADRSRLAAYARVCGYRDGVYGDGGTLPPAYPHVLAFPVTLALMTGPDFPLPVLGLVHTANRITVRRPIGADERLTLRVRAANRRPEAAGTAFDMVVRATVDRTGGEETVWESVSTYLRRGPGASGQRRAAPPTTGRPTAGGETQLWTVPADTGRRYAKVSGDRNPIHLHALTARLFGFRTAIAHGMWAKARVLAALEPRLPRAFTAEVTFRAPIPLPGSVRLASDGTRFALSTPDGGRTHLSGEVRPEA